MARNIFTDDRKFSAELNNTFQIRQSGVVELKNQIPVQDQVQFQRLVLLPGRGMNTYKLETFIPGYGTFQSIESLDLDKAESHFAQPDPFGNLSFMSGGAFMIPFSNRIRGETHLASSTIVSQVGSKKVNLSPNSKGQRPGAEAHALHGLILNKEILLTEMFADDSCARVKAELSGTDFGVGWPSKTHLFFAFEMQATSLQIKVQAKNVGNESTFVGIGWHPYFSIPSQDRRQVRLKIPARARAKVNNYDDVFPTGEILSVNGTSYDLSAGKSLDDLALDDCFMDLLPSDSNSIEVQLIDPKAKYGLHLKTKATSIDNFQVYAPLDKNFVCIEPQTHRPDPFSYVWGTQKAQTWLEPGQSIEYEVGLSLLQRHEISD